MRKQVLLMLILCLTTSLTWAERIDVATARKVAGSVAQREGATGDLRSASELSLVYAAASGQSGSSLRSGTMEGAADYFVFNFPDGKGFAIVAGDDRVRPVLGYSDEGHFDPDHLPEHLQRWLAGYQEQIAWAVNRKLEATPEISAEWRRYISGTALRAVGETKVLPTAKWSQERPYNNQTPVIGGQATYTGCCATAAAIIMRHHEYPKTVVTKGVSSYYVRGVKYPVTYAPYQWELMPLEYRSGDYTEEQADQVAALMWNIGANAKMNYGVIGSQGSSAYITDITNALRNVFGYSPTARYVYKSDYRWEEWKSMIRTEIDKGCPMAFNGANEAHEAHLFVLDGYAPDESFHFNWGWGGTYDGFYLLTALTPGPSNFNHDMGMIMGIKPAEAGDRPIYVLTYLSLSTPLTSLVDRKSFTVSVGFKNTGSDVFDGYINIGVVNEKGNITPVSVAKPVPRLEVAYYYEPWSFSCLLSKPLDATDKILPICSLDGTHWEVMPGAADAPLYIGRNGAVEEEDTPNDPTDQPINAGIHWNGFDAKYLPVSGLDNHQYNGPSVQHIGYYLTNTEENAVIRYTLKEYADWAGQLEIYTGEDYSLCDPDKGNKVTIDANGSFEVTVPPEQIVDELYVHYLKVLSDKVGELAYNIQVFSESNRETPAFERSGNKMNFVRMKGSWDKNPIRGEVNQEIPFGVMYSDITDFLVGKELALSITIGGATKEQVQLLDETGQEIPLSIRYNNEKYVGADLLPVGPLAADKLYSFRLKSNTVFPDNKGITMSIMATVDGQEAPASSMNSALIIIDPAKEGTANETIEADELRVWAANGCLYVRTPVAATAHIVTFDGRMHKTWSLSAGMNREEMPQGLYIIHIGRQSYKLKF